MIKMQFRVVSVALTVKMGDEEQTGGWRVHFPTTENVPCLVVPRMLPKAFDAAHLPPTVY